MKKKLFFAAMAIVALASCSSDEIVGDSPTPNPENGNTNAIVFSSGTKAVTRGDIYGSVAADLLGNNFYVMGTKGTGTSSATEPATSPTTTLVFDNYLVHYGTNTAGTTESNTANWEYVGITPGTAPYGDYVYLSSLTPARAEGQTIKYWDYSTDQYDFFAFSTGKGFKAVSGTSTAADEIGVTAMKYGADLASNSVAYTFDIPSVAALQSAYITDITKVLKANYGKEVQLKFKNLGSKVRIALYETIPGYAVKDVNFYQWDGTTDFATGTGKVKGTDGALISANTNGFPHDATIAISFPHVGNKNIGEQDYDKASATVTPVTANSQKWQTFGTLDNYASTYEGNLTGGSYLGRTLPTATFAGDEAAKYYQIVFPVSSPSPITLRVDYTLLSTDGSGEEIKIYGAKAVVPATYTKWLPNYAYTYIFKISDNTNGWTDPSGSDPAGLFPITFDAVVAEATDANAEQTTITTVAAPTITTYQQNHNPNKNGAWISTDEYSKATGKNIYVQVMDNSTATATLKSDLNGNTPEGKAKSLLYKLDNDDATEAIVMDALENRTATYDGDAASIKGRNGLSLAKQTISNTETSIVNGVNDDPIVITAGQAAMITITGTGALGAGTYAYVYDYTTLTGSATKRAEIEEYQPIVPGTSYIEGSESTKTFYTVTTTQLGAISAETAAVDLTAEGANNYLYFSKTTNGTGTSKYSYISIVGKTTLPAGVVKIAKSSAETAAGNTAPADGTFYFDKYFSNDGKYAVKVIKIVA